MTPLNPEKPGFLRAIGLWNPHATLMVIGEKQNETRPKITHIRGRVYIHSCLTREWEHMYCQTEFFEAFARHGILRENLKYGYILGSVEIIGSMPTEDLQILSPKERAFGDYSPGRGVWVTTNPQLLDEPIRFTGQQGFFWIPACRYCQKYPVEKQGQCCVACHFDRMS